MQTMRLSRHFWRIFFRKNALVYDRSKNLDYQSRRFFSKEKNNFKI